MNTKNIIITALLCAFIVANLSAQLTAKASFGTFLLKNGTIITGTGDTIVGDLIIEENRIKDIGSNLSIKEGDQIDCTGKYIYPGFFDSGTGLGLNEISSISLTSDSREIGKFNPQLKALTAINPNSVLIPVTRVNGITTVLSKPSGNIFPGKAALINLWGYTPKEMSLQKSFTMINFPIAGKRHRWDRRNKDDIKKQYEEARKDLDQYIEKAVCYKELIQSKSSNINYNPEMEALQGILNQKEKVIINVNRSNDILEAIKWVKSKSLDAILSGVKEGYLVADSIAKAGIPVIVGPILATPSRSNASFASNYKNASVLHKAGVKIAIQTTENENVRNLPYHAGFAAAYGLGKEEALKAITIYPAEIFGVDKDYGSISLDKMANLLITDGDPFETKTTIEEVFIKGYRIPMESRHTLLYDEFLERTSGINNNK